MKATSSAQVGISMYTLPRWYPNDGFTKGLFPLIAGLLMSEAKYEVSQVQKTLFIGLFDVVQHMLHHLL
jgi:hypothetical protein